MCMWVQKENKEEGEHSLSSSVHLIFFFFSAFLHTSTTINIMVIKKEWTCRFLFFVSKYNFFPSLSLSLYIYTQTLISLMNMMWTYIVRSFYSSYDLINNSLFVRIRALRYTLLRWSLSYICIHAIQLLFVLFIVEQMSHSSD
jgi:hypothetical protein